MYGDPQVLESAEQTQDMLAFRSVIEVIGTEILVRCTVLEHVMNRGEDRSGDSSDGLFASTA